MRRWFRKGALIAPLFVLVWAGSAQAQTIVIQPSDSTRAEGDHKVRIKDSEGHTLSINVDTGTSSGIVRFGESITVRKGEEVHGDVVSIGGSVRAEGEIWGDCVAIGGTVHVIDGSHVHGDVVSIGGTLTLDPGVSVNGDAVSVWGRMKKDTSAVVSGDVVEVGGLGPVAWGNGWNGGFNGLWAVGNLIRRIVWVAILLGLGVLLLHVFPGQMTYLTETIQTSGLKAFLFGILFWILWLPVVIALCITVIGIIAALGLIFLTPLIMLLGYLGAAKALGMRFSGGPMQSTRPFMVGLLTLEGGVILARIIGVGGVMGFVSMILSTIAVTAIFLAMTTGVGALMITRFRSGPRRPEADSGAEVRPQAPAPPAQPADSV